MPDTKKEHPKKQNYTSYANKISQKLEKNGSKILLCFKLEPTKWSAVGKCRIAPLAVIFDKRALKKLFFKLSNNSSSY